MKWKTDTRTAAQLTAAGYRRVSRKFGGLARIDRLDWWPFLEEQGLRIDLLTRGDWADHYRRVYSKDCVEVPHAVSEKVPTSGHDPVGFIDA